MFTLAEIKSLLSPNAVAKLSASNEEMYSAIVKRANEIVNLNTGIDTSIMPRPANLNALTTPFAWICEYLVAIQFNNSDTYINRVKAQYDNAIAMLKPFKVAAPSGTQKAVLRRIRGCYR